MKKIITKAQEIKESVKLESDKTLREIENLKIRLRNCEDFLQANSKAISSIFSILLPKNNVAKKDSENICITGSK